VPTLQQVEAVPPAKRDNPPLAQILPELKDPKRQRRELLHERMLFMSGQKVCLISKAEGQASVRLEEAKLIRRYASDLTSGLS